MSFLAKAALQTKLVNLFEKGDKPANRKDARNNTK